MTAGLLLLAAGLALSSLGVARLIEATLAPDLVLWIALPLLGGPLSLWAGFQLHGLLRAEYQLDRDRLSLRWGLARERIPIGQIEAIRRPAGDQELRPPGGLRLPGCRLGLGQIGDEPVEYLATDLERLLVAQTAQGTFAFTPGDPEAFLERFVSFSRMGSVRQLEPRSERPQLLPALIWSDRAARALLLAGLLLPLALLSYLVLRAPGLPVEVPFGFQPAGEPGPAAPAGRLLLLPLIGGLIWLIDLLLGAWLYRRASDRPLSYALWGLAVLTGGLLWGAAVWLLRAA